MEFTVAVIFNLLLVGGSVYSGESPELHKDCGSPNAKLVHVEFIPPCEKQACILRRGEEVTVMAHFLPKINSKVILVNAYQTTQSYFSVETLMVQVSSLNYSIGPIPVQVNF